MDFNMLYVDSTASTNTLAKQLVAESKEGLPDFTVIVAEEQTAGKGQGTNTWESERGKNLTFSLICHPSFIVPSEQFIISQTMALSIFNTVQDLSQPFSTQVLDVFSVKWPNDIYYGNKKLSGTLIECSLREGKIQTCIIGVGLNVNQTEFHSDAPNPISLSQIFGRTFDCHPLMYDIVKHFVSLYETYLKKRLFSDIRTMYESSLYRQSGKHLYRDRNGEFLATYAGITIQGQLQLQKGNAEICTYNFKEVSYL